MASVPPTLVWCDGFEYGLATPRLSDVVLAGELYEKSNAVGAGAALSCVAGALRPGGNGAYFLRCASGTPSANYTYVEKVLASGAGQFGVCSVIFRPVTLPSADTLFFGMGNETSQIFSELAVLSTGGLGIRARSADAFTALTGFTFTANRAYKIDQWLDTGASGTVTFSTKVMVTDLTTGQIYGPQTVNAAGTNTFQTVTTLGICQNDNVAALGASVNFDFDDLVCSTTSADFPLPDCEVIGLPVTGVGTHNLTAGDLSKTDDSGTNWENLANPETVVQALSSWTLLDEIPWSATDIDWVRQTVARATSYAEYTKTALPAYATTPLGVMLAAHVKMATAAAGTIDAKISSGGTDSTGINTTHNAVARAMKAIFVRLNPSGGVAWTKASLDAATVRILYAGTVTGVPHFVAVLPQVAYAIAAAPATTRVKVAGRQAVMRGATR